MTRRRGLLWAAIWLGCVAGFFALGARAATGDVWSLDLEVSRWVQGGPSIVGTLSTIANRVNSNAGVTVATTAAIVVLLARGSPGAALIVLSTLLPRALQHEFKYVFNEPRPSIALVRVSDQPGDPGYPSGHVVGVTAFFGIIFALAPVMFGRGLLMFSARSACLFLILWISVARVWVGAHWASDAVGGYLFGAMYLIPVLNLPVLRRG